MMMRRLTGYSKINKRKTNIPIEEETSINLNRALKFEGNLTANHQRERSKMIPQRRTMVGVKMRDRLTSLSPMTRCMNSKR